MGCWDDGGGWVRVGVRGWAISSSERRHHGVEICLSAADIPNTTFARTSMLLMFESCNERPRCDRDCVSLRSGSGTVHLRAKSPSSSILTPSYSFTALAFPAPLNRGLSSCKSLSFGQNATSAAAGLGSNARPLSTVRFVAGALQSFTRRASPVGDAWGWATRASGRFR